MRCSQVRDLLPDYAVQLLDGRTVRAVEAHLEVCAGCRAERSAQDAAVALVERYGALEPPPGLFHGIRQQIEAGGLQRERPAWWAFLLTRPARAAAMGMAMASVALGLFWPTGPRPDAGVRIEPHSGAHIAASELAGSIRQHAMSAGQGPLTDRVAWEAMAQLVGPGRAADAEVEKRPGVD